MRSSPDF